MTAQGKTEGRHPGLPLPTFYDPERVAQKNRWYVLCRPFRAEYLGGSHTQGGGEYALPWAVMFCPFRATAIPPFEVRTKFKLKFI